MSHGHRNVIVKDLYFLCSLEDKLPLSFESVVVCCRLFSFLCYSRQFFLCLVPFLIFCKKIQLFILLLFMIVMTHQNQHSLWAEIAMSVVILGCVHVLESELKADIISYRNEDKQSRMHFKCKLNDHYNFSASKEYRNSHLPKIS